MAEKDLKSLSKANEKLKKDIAEKQNELDTMNSTIREWENEISDKQKQKIQAQKEEEDFKKKIKELENEGISLDRQIAGVTKDLNEKKKVIFERRSEGYDTPDTKKSGGMSFERALSILKLKRGCTEDDVATQVNELTFQYGPVCYDGPDSEQKLDEISKAREVVLKNIK